MPCRGKHSGRGCDYRPRAVSREAVALYCRRRSRRPASDVSPDYFALASPLGARQRDIVMRLLREAVVICASGASIGLLFGATLAYLIAAFAGWQVAWPALLILVSTLLCALVGLAFAVYPARQAAQLDPIAAIRAE